MKADIDTSDWLKKDLEDAAREVESLPLWMKQVAAVSERPLELSQEATRLKKLSKQSLEPTGLVDQK